MTERQTQVAKAWVRGMWPDHSSRQRGDSNPCGQSPMDFESIPLAARTHCHWYCIPGKVRSIHAEHEGILPSFVEQAVAAIRSASKIDGWTAAWLDGRMSGQTAVRVQVICVYIYIYIYIHTYISIYLSIYRSIDLSIYRSIDLSIYRSTDLSIYRSIDLSIYPSIYLSIYVFLFLPLYLSLYIYIYMYNYTYYYHRYE